MRFLNKSRVTARSNGLLGVFFAVSCILVNGYGTSAAATGQSTNAVQKLLNGLNNDINRCDNFYDYVCQKYNEEHGDLLNIENGFVKDAVQKELLGILSESDKADDIDELKAARKFHKACMNTDERNNRGIEPIVSIFDQNGGWPLLRLSMDWNSNYYTWQIVDAEYTRLLGLSALFDLTVFREGTNYLVPFDTIALGPPSFKSRPAFLSNTTEFNDEKYLQFVMNVVLTFMEATNSPVPSKDVVPKVADMVAFEKKLMEIVRNAEENYDYEEYTVADIKTTQQIFANASNVAKINLASVIPGIFKEIADINVETHEKVLVHKMGYFNDLIPLLEQTKPQTVVNYIHWNFVLNMLPHTNDKMKGTIDEMKSSVSGITKKEEANDVQCLSQNAAKNALYYEFARRRLAGNVETEVNTMIENIGNVLYNMIGQSGGSKAMQDLMKKIVDEVPRYIGSSDNYKDSTKVQEYYEGLTVGEHHFENVMASTKYQYRQILRALQNSEKSADIAPVKTTGFYEGLLKSELVIPASMLQEPFFSLNQPKSLNYAGLGSFIGYMLFNSYQDSVTISGAIMEKHLHNLQCFATWSKTSSEIPQIRAKVVRKRLGTYVGLNAAYQAYRALDQVNEEQLAEFNDHQLFFVSFAKSQCVANFDSKTAQDPVTVSIANNKDFGNVFSCPVGSQLNREKKCHLLEPNTQN